MAAETFSPEVPAAPTAAGRLEELGVVLDPRVRYRLESVFPKVAGFGWKKAILRKCDLIARIEPVLRRALAGSETVLYVAKGVQQVSFLEQYFMGVWAASLNQTVFVVTDARLLLFRTNSEGVPKQTFWSVYHTQIDRFKPSWTGGIELRLRDGKKLKFRKFPKVDRSSMPELSGEAVATFRRHGFDPQVTQSLENLCSHCFARVPKGEHDCDRCGAMFWSPAAVALRSLVFPSWGNLCMGHHLLAAMEIGWSLLCWITVISRLADPEERGAFQFVAAALIVGFWHGVDAALTYAIAKKGLHPRRASKAYAAKSATASTISVSPV